MSPQQQLANSKIALKRWMEVPRKNVSPGLMHWTDNTDKAPDCGTVACFGGWLAVMPEFVAMGVSRTRNGRPDGFGQANPAALSVLLFGKSMFSMTSLEEDDEAKGNTHKVVQNRLKKNIKRLEVEMRKL